MKKIIISIFLLISVVTFIGCSKGEDSNTATDKTKNLYDGVTLNIPLAYGGAENSFAKFTEKTGIKIEYVEISTGAELAKLKAENGKTNLDVWFGGGVDSYIAARDLGYLQSYISPEAAGIDTQYKEKNGNYTGLALVPIGFVVNKDILTKKGLEVPKTWEDLANPKYKDEIIMADPSISGTSYAMVSGLNQAWGEEKGWDYFSRLNKNISFFAKGGGEPLEKVAAGEFAIGVVALTGGSFKMEKQSPVDVISPQDLIPWTPAPIAIFKNTKNLGAAKVFVDYMLSKEGQNVLKEADARIMARADVVVPDLLKKLDTSKLVKLDVEKMGKTRESTLSKWKEIIGNK